MSDIVERAEAWRDHGLGSDPVAELIDEVKRLRGVIENTNNRLCAEIDRLNKLHAPIGGFGGIYSGGSDV